MDVATFNIKQFESTCSHFGVITKVTIQKHLIFKPYDSYILYFKVILARILTILKAKREKFQKVQS